MRCWRDPKEKRNNDLFRNQWLTISSKKIKIDWFVSCLAEPLKLLRSPFLAEVCLRKFWHKKEIPKEELEMDPKTHIKIDVAHYFIGSILINVDQPFWFVVRKVLLQPFFWLMKNIRAGRLIQKIKTKLGLPQEEFKKLKFAIVNSQEKKYLDGGTNSLNF